MIVDYSRIPAKLYRLRWRFTYSDGKPDVYGTWDETSKHKENKASFQNKNNLARAIIEGEYRGKNRNITQFIDIPGHEMRHVRCEAFSPLSIVKLIDSRPGVMQPFTLLSSMFFHTDDKMYGVDVTGQTFTRKIETIDKFKSFEHSAGV